MRHKDDRIIKALDELGDRIAQKEDGNEMRMVIAHLDSIERELI